MREQREFEVERMRVHVHEDTASLGRSCAAEVAGALRVAVEERGTANAMFATGNSQLAFVEALADCEEVPWRDVVVFHMDEYVGVGPDHPAGFQHWIRERIVDRVKPKDAYFLHGEADADTEATRYASLLRSHPLDVCCLGIGENGHLAFNDPPVAKFDDPLDVKVVELDPACRRQQVHEGHFPDEAAVPARAVTVTIPALLRASRVVAIVPEQRKAVPVREALYGPISSSCPASILRTRDNVVLHLDCESASLL
ncbi:MAG TPA: glucosamine-6-phosphate deaminase [Acidimicrobiales bacterium]|nr:glucosamine-6-phosphate deaminase [Acidimicrobiales bacterium]